MCTYTTLFPKVSKARRVTIAGCTLEPPTLQVMSPWHTDLKTSSLSRWSSLENTGHGWVRMQSLMTIDLHSLTKSFQGTQMVPNASPHPDQQKVTDSRIGDCLVFLLRSLCTTCWSQKTVLGPTWPRSQPSWRPVNAGHVTSFRT